MDMIENLGDRWDALGDGQILLVILLILGAVIALCAYVFEDVSETKIPDVDNIKQEQKKQEHVDEYL